MKVIKKIGIFLYSVAVAIFCLIKEHKKTAVIMLSFVLVVAISFSSVALINNIKKNNVAVKKASSEESVSSTKSQAVESVAEQLEEVVSEPEQVVESQPVAESEPIVESVPESVVTQPTMKYNNNLELENNPFLDAMVYCGYNLDKHRADGLMWQYILCSDKPHRGWLSKITYGGGCSGYETDANGMPNIARFERGGLVCASYATYVYFNYLPHVAGIDTSALARPNKSYDANDWYIAGQKWVEAGYSRYIEWTARESGTRTVFTPAEDIPIGSLMLLTDFKNRNNHCTHICLYAGYANGYHWVTHVGNANGPEFCAMERMSCGADPQWPLKIITTPTNLGLFDVTQ